MPTLSDKLKALGVKVGAQDLPPPRPPDPNQLGQVLGGQVIPTHQGETFLVESFYPIGHPHGQAGLQVTAPLGALARWAGAERIAQLPVQSFAFLDTETTGLAGGSGTYTFLIGVGRFEESQFHLAQYFMRDPAEEPAQLAAFEEFLAPCQALVTFNGKTFDAPLLAARFIAQGWQSPLTDLAHIDLLHLARRLWRDRLPSRSLSNLEWQILGALRTEEDVPGWMVPALYFQYLNNGDVQPLKKIFYHNAMDVLSLSALMDHMACLLSDPFEGGKHHSVDLIALARLFEDLGDLETATRLYIHGLEHDDVRLERLPQALLLEAIQRLAHIHKQQENYPAAVALWLQAVNYQHLEAHLELAKYYEHHLRDYSEAIHWTQAAIEVVESLPELVEHPMYLPLYERHRWLEELHHRLARLQNKLSSSQ